MSTENPYQSPEEDSDHSADEPPNNLLTTQRPTWRFWVLALLCIPAIAALVVLTYVDMRDSQTPGDALPGVLFSALVIIPFLASCALISIYWRTPARQ